MLREMAREFLSRIILKIFSRLSKEDKTGRGLAGKNKIFLVNIAGEFRQSQVVFTKDLEPISIPVV